MSKQRVFDITLGNINRGNKKEVYKTLLDFYKSLSDDERKQLDVSALHEMLLEDIAEFEGDLEIIYGFGNYDADFKKEAEERIKVCDQTPLICQYLEVNDVADDEFVSLGVRAIGAVMPDSETEVASLYGLREKTIQKGLYDEMLRGIKESGNVETVVCAALCFEPRLIDEIFGGKAQMYIYLSNAKFTDSECLEFFKDRLLTMDSNQLQNDIKASVKNLDAKIKSKSL